MGTAAPKAGLFDLVVLEVRNGQARIAWRDPKPGQPDIVPVNWLKEATGPQTFPGARPLIVRWWQP